MNRYIIQLPKEIINHIISYTYQLQPKCLLEDIESFHESRHRVNAIFHQIYAVGWNMDYPEEKYWLSNDLIGYMNKWGLTGLSYEDCFYNIFYRHYRLCSRSGVNLYLAALKDGPIESEINIFWGLLTKNEREEFICISSSGM